MDRLVTTPWEKLVNPEAFARDAWIKQQAQALPRGSRVLDAGAGASRYRPFFAHCQYETQDFCEYKGAFVQYLQPITYVCDITAIPLPEACLDAIVCTEVIEHVIDPMAVLAEFSRLLKPGGKLFLTSPLISHLHMEPYHFYGGFTHFWYRHWLPAKGFKVESIIALGGPGRTCSYFCQALYMACAAAEKRASFLWRWTSRFFRIFAKPLVFHVFPRLLPGLDAFLGSDVICNDYMVLATRLPSGKPDQS